MDVSTHPRHLLATIDRGSDARVAGLSILYAWLFYFALNTLRMAVGGAAHQLPMAERRIAVTVVGMVLTAALYLVLRPFNRSCMAARLGVAFAASAPASFAYAAFNYYMFYIYAPVPFWPADVEHMGGISGALPNIISTAMDWYFFIAAWAVLYIALSNAAQVRDAEREAALYRAEAQSAQLRALRYQLNPHFLFNTLNSLSTLVMRRNPDQAERMIETLAAFLRVTLANDPTEDTALAEEIRSQLLYLDIEQVRFPDRLRVAFVIPPELERARIPGLLLQPLVENAVKYGVARSSDPVTITLTARAAGSLLYLTVEDDGADANLSTVGPPGGHGVGLRNVRARLLARFGPQAGCVYGVRAEGGFRVDLHMPLQLQK